MSLTSFVSYPDRGKGGRSDFRGNCSPRLIQDLFEHYRPRLVYDPAIGSGTSRDVAQRLGIPGFFTDLAQGFDVRANEPSYSGFDFAFWHPPYWDIIKYSGPGGQWGGRGNPSDLSLIEDYDAFVCALDEATFRIYETLQRGGHLAVLVGDVRRRGLLYSIQRDMRWFGEPEAFIVKAQHNTTSERRQYGSNNFVAIVTEYLVITKKPDAWVVPLRITDLSSSVDTRNWSGASWQAIVRSGLEALGGEASLPELYETLSAHRRAKIADHVGTDWQAIVRRELQERPHFTPVKRGRWRLVQPVAAAKAA